jgi:hypothetical protein
VPTAGAGNLGQPRNVAHSFMLDCIILHSYQHSTTDEGQVNDMEEA